MVTRKITVREITVEEPRTRGRLERGEGQDHCDARASGHCESKVTDPTVTKAASRSLQARREVQVARGKAQDDEINTVTRRLGRGAVRARTTARRGPWILTVVQAAMRPLQARREVPVARSKAQDKEIKTVTRRLERGAEVPKATTRNTSTEERRGQSSNPVSPAPSGDNTKGGQGDITEGGLHHFPFTQILCA